MLTIVFTTARREPKIQWFLRSLHRETRGEYKDIRIVIVDFYAQERNSPFERFNTDFHWISPKPNPWNGPYRLTKENWFAAANARNTGLCMALDGYVAYVDDLSVLLPGWLAQVRLAMQGSYVACGAYKKVKDLVVDKKGNVTSCEEFPAGVDNRLAHAQSITDCAGNWLYGCSCAIPVEALLSVNGWPEDLADGLGSEDYCCGLAMENAGWKFKYDPTMMTYESEELHHAEPAFKRSDYGVSPNDKSHKALHIAQTSKRFPNTYDIAELRQRILAGGSFPIRQNPQHDWYTKKHLSEL